MKRTFTVLAIAAVLALVVAAGAFAGGSTLLGGYGGEAGAGTNIQPKGHVAAVKSGTLPFTGTDLAVAAGAGLLLLGSGFGLRRLGRNKN